MMARAKQGQTNLFAKPDTHLRFDRKLILNQWILSLFEVASFEELTAALKIPEYEGFDEDNISRYYHVLAQRLFDRPELSADLLLSYDRNIVRHWKRITQRRNREGHLLYPKYFQYFSLLFAEIYLDRYFRDKRALLDALNACLDDFNERNEKQNRLTSYTPEDLNKLAFWSATGSGKTLLMHVNILQYLHYVKKENGGRSLNRIILLTPNEGLSHQHHEEFIRSAMEAEIFAKEAAGLFTGTVIDIIDIHKLREEGREKTVAVESFEGNNLVLVDEGHRGASGAEIGQWMHMRNRLCENGFSFEYSATFGQAMKASANKELEQDYAKCILFDYSYKYFYRDGYGKDYRILNLEDDSDEEIRIRYLTANLLAFYQQLKLFAAEEKEFIPFLIERPLWIFVGGSVRAVRQENKRNVSDVVDILLFLSRFIKNKKESVRHIAGLLKGRSNLRDKYGNDIFRDSFQYLGKLGITAEDAFNDVMNLLFNAPSPASIHVENLKGTDGEIALRIGENDPFGLINVGDASSLCKLCEHFDELVVSDRDFSGSFFHAINEEESKINVLIGSKKFMEGWNSWRVSAMGLMNIGKTEGSQIIQLFGRGVRLKGHNFSLKRSRNSASDKAPKFINLLETLNVFGIRADYMRQFKEYLEEEGLPANEDRIEIVLPVIKNLGRVKLKAVRVKPEYDFKKQGEKPFLARDEEFIRNIPVELDWYPQIQSLSSSGNGAPKSPAEKQEGRFTAKHVAFMDVDYIYSELQQFKNERAWYNLNLPRSGVRGLMGDASWYRLFIPPDELEFRSFDQVRRWEEIASVLLKKYCERFYNYKKSQAEHSYLEYYEISEDDPNFIEAYSAYVEKSREDLIADIKRLGEQIKKGSFANYEFPGVLSIGFRNLLYYPLIYVRHDLIEIKPVVLENDDERDFVLDLKSFCERNKSFFTGKELYVIRNRSRGKGVGFFDTSGFYPDFIIWLLNENRQYVTFVDPKGIRMTRGLTDPKIEFYRTIKEIEKDLGDPNIILNSFIISTTRKEDVFWDGNKMSKEEYERHHVLFQKNDKETYIKNLLSMLVR